LANSIHCPNCGQTYQLAPEQVPQYAGQTITCTSCNRRFTVPADGGTFAPPSSSRIPESYSAPAAAGSNGLAVASLVCAILGLCVPVIPGVIAIVTGILGLKRANDPRGSGRGLAIAGISIGAVSILLSTCMVSILLPSLNRAREMANRVKCAANMRQIGVELQMYASSNAGQYPPDLDTLLAKSNTLTPSVFACPSSSDTAAPSNNQLSAGGHLSYVYFPDLTNSSPANRLVLYENPTDHHDGVNMLFGDGHVDWIPMAQAQPMIAQMKAAQRSTP
jgi:prepilin-type processing-associated H-X9-DG protein